MKENQKLNINEELNFNPGNIIVRFNIEDDKQILSNNSNKNKSNKPTARQILYIKSNFYWV